MFKIRFESRTVLTLPEGANIIILNGTFGTWVCFDCLQLCSFKSIGLISKLSCFVALYIYNYDSNFYLEDLQLYWFMACIACGKNLKPELVYFFFACYPNLKHKLVITINDFQTYIRHGLGVYLRISEECDFKQM